MPSEITPSPKTAPIDPPPSETITGQSFGSDNPPTASYHPHASPYVDLHPHARGGIGEVFRATDAVLNRTVAVKRLQNNRATDAESRRRFLVEAEITARLEHPGVVPVHSLFTDDRGAPAYAMRFVQGPTLGDAIKEFHAGTPDPVAFRRLLQSFILVCQTVAYAHTRGVIHRDLKPQNILLGKFGETLVVDWGLAKVVGRPEESRAETPMETTLVPNTDGTGSETAMGSAVGTPSYMSPEQAAGRWDVVTQPSDIYGLGAVLYTILTGRAPLEKGNWPEMQQRIQQGDFPRPRQIKPDVPIALEAVCLKAMALVPSNRYPSAESVAEDIEHWLADEPVVALRDGFVTKVRRWSKRNRTLVSGAVALLVTGLIAAGIALGVLGKKNREIDHQRQVAETSQRKSEAINRFLIDDLLRQADPANNSVREKMTVRQLLDKAAARIEVESSLSTQPEVEAELRSVLGRAFENLGASEQAAQHYFRAWKLRESLLGPNHLETLTTRNEYVYVLVDADLDPQSLTLAREANLACTSALGEEHPETARSLATLGSGMISSGDSVGAEPILRRSSSILYSSLGPNHRQTLDVDNSLAVALGTSGRAAEAETILNSIVIRRRKNPRDPDLALAIGNQGYTLLMLNKFREAEILANEAVIIGNASVGPTAPGTLQARGLQGYAYEGQQRWEEAEKVFLSVLEDRSRALQPSSFDVQRSLGFLARVHAKQKRWSESSFYIARLILAQKPNADRKTDALSADLAAALAGKMDPKLAEPILQEAMTAVKIPLWPGDWLRAELASHYGNTLRQIGDFERAKPILESAASDVAKSVGPPAWSIATSRKRVADLYIAWNKPDEVAKWK